MDARFLGEVGYGRQGLSDGSASTARIGKNGEVIVAPSMPDLAEASSRGLVFGGSSYGAISTGAVPSQAVSSTTTTNNPFVLWNPQRSGVNAVLLDLEIVYFSGTFAAGTTFISQGINQQIVTFGTDCLPTSALVGSGARPQCRLMYQPTLTVAPVATTALRHTDAFVATATTVAYGTYSTSIYTKYFNGMFTVLPGSLISITGNQGAGTNPLENYNLRWLEVPTATIS